MSILTPPTISRLPLGLLRFLGIQSGGQYPLALRPELGTVWDTFQLLHANHHELIQQTNAAVAAAGMLTLANFFVPNGEVWFVRAASLQITTGAGEAWAGVLEWIPFGAPAAGSFGHPLCRAEANAASQTITLGSMSVGGDGFFMGPGDILGIRTISLTGAIDFITQAQISRLPI